MLNIRRYQSADSDIVWKLAFEYERNDKQR